MERTTKPENLFIARKRGLTAFAAIAFTVFGLFFGIAGPVALFRFPPEDNTVLILLCIAFPLIALYLLSAAALNFRNLFFPYVLTSDEKGIYNYSGMFHFGFIGWADIEAITKDATVLDFLDNETPCIKIAVKDLKRYRSGISFGKKWLLFWGSGTVKIYTLCSHIKRRQLAGLLENALAYYRANDETTVKNEQ